MRTLSYLLGALYELVTGWPWRDVVGAAALILTTASVYALLLLWAP